MSVMRCYFQLWTIEISKSFGVKRCSVVNTAKSIVVLHAIERNQESLIRELTLSRSYI